MKVTPSVFKYYAIKYVAGKLGKSFNEVSAQLSDIARGDGYVIQIDEDEDFFGNEFAETIQDFMLRAGIASLFILEDE